MVDAFRIPLLVRQLNLETEEEEDIANVVSNFHKQGHSVISSMRKNDNYTRFDDVMQKHPTDGSPRIFTTKSNETGKYILNNTNVYFEIVKIMFKMCFLF